MLSPFVYWAQTENQISLRVDLKNVDKTQLDIDGNQIKFTGQGIGAHGKSDYGFTLDLYSEIKTENSIDDQRQVRVFDNRVDIVLTKSNNAWWPRLTAQPQKPAWLKINFDLWKSEDPADNSDSEVDRRDVMKDYPGMFDNLHKEEMGYKREDYKKVYLIVYNLFQFIGFMYVLSVMCVRYLKLGESSIPSTYEHVGIAMKLLTQLQLLEVMHPMFGYVKGSPLQPFLQVFGRLWILFAMIDSEPRMQTKPVVFYLFIAWSMIEVVRYPFYISQLYKRDIGLLTWLRYTIWIPLYPLGIMCEGIIVLRNIPYFQETQKFTVSMPNAWNFAFHMPTFMWTYLICFLIPGGYFMMMYMHRQRNIKLESKVVIRKNL